MSDHDEQTVVRGLEALKQESRDLEAPLSVEQELLRVFRSRWRPARNRSRLWIPAAAAAALAVGFWFGLRPAPIEPLPGLEATLRFSPPVAHIPINRTPAVRRVPRPPKPVLAGQRRLPEAATDFIPMYPALPHVPDETVQVVRISLPRSEMLRFGLPVGPGPQGARVKADVLLSEDGIARAIRFVR